MRLASVWHVYGLRKGKLWILNLSIRISVLTDPLAPHKLTHMDNNTRDKGLDRMFHALADGTRRAVVQRLLEGEATVSDLADPHPMALPNFLKHVRVLEESGLIASRKTGRVRTCEINIEALARVERWAITQREIWERKLDRLEMYLDGGTNGPSDN